MQGAEGVAGYPEPPFTRVCLNFNHLDIHTRRGDAIWPPSRGSRLLLPFVLTCLNFSPRSLSELSVETTLCQQHLRPSQKKHRKKGTLVVHMRLANCRDWSRIQPKLKWKCVLVGVDALAVVWQKSRSHVYDGAKKKNCDRTSITPQSIQLHYGFNMCKTVLVSKKQKTRRRI